MWSGPAGKWHARTPVGKGGKMHEAAPWQSTFITLTLDSNRFAVCLRILYFRCHKAEHVVSEKIAFKREFSLAKPHCKDFQESRTRNTQYLRTYFRNNHFIRFLCNKKCSLFIKLPLIMQILFGIYLVMFLNNPLDYVVLIWLCV